MEDIKDIFAYTIGMRKSIIDKIWFLNLIDDSIDTIYDYGCADGFLLKTVGELMPNMKLRGYDINDEMRVLSRNNVPNAKIYGHPIFDNKNTVLCASSVFHEIHSYGKNMPLEYSIIFESGATYIAIRDMFYSNNACHPTDEVQLARVLQHEPRDKITEFEAFNGKLSENKNFLHYLLKYRYEANWDREVRENYFPHSIEDFLSKIPNKYEIVYFNNYTLPFLRDKVMQDFGFTLTDYTHAKILLKLKES